MKQNGHEKEKTEREQPKRFKHKKKNTIITENNSEGNQTHILLFRNQILEFSIFVEFFRQNMKNVLEGYRTKNSPSREVQNFEKLFFDSNCLNFKSKMLF